jgi:hypothetical protein
MSFGLGQQSSGSGDGVTTAASPAVPVGDVDASTPWVAAADGNLPLLQRALHLLNLTVAAADDNQGYTLLQAAASYGQIPVLTWLLSQVQAKVAGVPDVTQLANAVDRDGDSALHYAGTAATARFLVVEAGIDVRLRNSVGLTALEAKRRELEEIMCDEDFEEDDVDYLHAKEIVEYLQSLSMLQQ